MAGWLLSWYRTDSCFVQLPVGLALRVSLSACMPAKMCVLCCGLMIIYSTYTRSVPLALVHMMCRVWLPMNLAAVDLLCHHMCMCCSYPTLGDD